MPDQSTFKVEAVDWSDIGYQLMAGFAKLAGEVKAGDGLVSTLAKKEGAVAALALELMVDIAVRAGEGLHKLEEPFFPIIAGFVAPIVAGLFGANVDASTFSHRLAHGDAHETARSIVDKFLQAIEGDGGGELAPGPEGGARVASAAVAASLESTFNAIVPELLSDLLPLDLGHFKELTELPEGIIRALGVGRLVRRAVGPLVTVCAATPMEWHVHKKYRPTLLGASSCARQILRNHGDPAKWYEELRRQGYDETRIEALINEQRKTFSVADVRTFYAREEWDGVRAERYLRDQGYDEEAAHDALRLEGLRRFEQLEGQEASALITAYAARDIDRPTFDAALEAHVAVASERALHSELAELRRALNVKRLSSAQVERMVKSGVLAFVDYREAVRREGYPEEDVTALELQLRAEVDAARSLEEHRAELAAARAEEKQARDDAAAVRRAEVAADRALAKRGSEADLERAVVRGIIPVARLEEVYRARYDADTVEPLLALVESDRVAYVAQQQAAEDARKRGARRNLSSSEAEASYHAGLISADELRAKLETMGYSAGDAALITGTAVAQQADLDRARAKRREADEAAAHRSIDLGRYEQLVRHGARTLAQYDTLLASLGFDEAARVDMRELLSLTMADDATARRLRAEAATKPAAPGLTLEQVRRAVLLGVQTVDQFESYLLARRYTVDATTVLVAELRADLDAAEAARRRREAGVPGPQAPGLPLSTVRRAAQLGLIPVDTYRARLEDAGYSDDDIDIDLELLLAEMADVQAKRATAPPPASSAPARGLSLADLERAVKAGSASVDEYIARAVTLGYSSADAALLGEVLESERSTLAAARKRRDELAFTLAADGHDLKALEAQVKAGELEVGDYTAALASWGSDAAEADLLAALLVFTLGG